MVKSRYSSRGFFMRHGFFATPVMAMLATLAPAIMMSGVARAQTAPVEVRVDRLEKEMKAVQRKVFPGGTPLEADIRSQPAPPVQTGSPSSTPISDLISRVDALESQLATLTGQTEQNAYKIKQLEDAFARYKTEAATATAGPPPTVPTQPAAAAPPRAAPAPVASDARKAAVAVIEKPDTGDAPADAYTYGYRLWDAKFYPEAQAQLKATVEKYESNGVASRASNLLGRAYLDDGKPALASVAFYENYQKRPRGDRAADSLAWLGEALIQLKKPADACKVYGELQQVYGATLSATLRGMMDKGKVRAKCGE
jgi:TolA-binding protein